MALKQQSLDQSDEIYKLKNFQEQLLNNIVLRGIKNIDKVILRKIQDSMSKNDGEYQKQETWVLDTVGTNLLDILALDYIDVNRTLSNDIIETYKVLGIEAARQVLMKEIKDVINASDYVNYRHMSLLCDIMTNRGYLMSIDRFGINRDMDIGPLAKCSFEETTEQIFKAAIFGEVDKLDGVSANIMMGQLIPSGTGDSKILLDEMKLLNVKAEKKKEDKTEEVADTYCQNNLGIDFDINAI